MNYILPTHWKPLLGLVLGLGLGEDSNSGVQPFSISGPHWKEKSCLGPHIKYTVTCHHTKISSCFK